MFTVKVAEETYNYCLALVENFNFGKRKVANGTKQQQLTGIIGQNVVLKLFDLPLLNGKEGFDDGVDLVFDNKKIDVKTMGRTTYPKSNYTNNFLKLQDYFTTEIYIFCSYHKTNKELTVCGWINKNSFVEKRRFYSKNSIRKRFDGTSFTTFADLYEIDNKDLNNVTSIEDLKTQLLNFNGET